MVKPRLPRAPMPFTTDFTHPFGVVSPPDFVQRFFLFPPKNMRELFMFLQNFKERYRDVTFFGACMMASYLKGSTLRHAFLHNWVKMKSGCLLLLIGQNKFLLLN